MTATERIDISAPRRLDDEESASSTSSQRPLITFGIITYNQERFVTAALQGAIAQTYSPLEIVISDDCSSDSTFEVLQELVSEYDGPHKVHLHLNEQNLGLSGNLGQLMQLARGDLIVAAAGDDISLPQRTERLYEAYVRSGGKALSIYSNARIIDEAGNPEGLYLGLQAPERLSLSWMAKYTGGVLGCTQAWHRSVFDMFGPMDPQVTREDVVIPFRAGLLGEIAYVDEDLVLYRRHADNFHFADLSDIRDVKQWQKRSSTHAIGNVAIARARREDVETVSAGFPEREHELREIRHLLDAEIRDMEIERRLFELPRREACSVIGAAALNGTRPRRVVRWALWFVIPELYYRWLHLKAHARRRLRTLFSPSANPAAKHRAR
ncbi:MAG TPA: glycosyltransferase [Chloroflexota bacterium]